MVKEVIGLLEVIVVLSITDEDDDVGEEDPSVDCKELLGVVCVVAVVAPLVAVERKTLAIIISDSVITVAKKGGGNEDRTAGGAEGLSFDASPNTRIDSAAIVVSLDQARLTCRSTGTTARRRSM